MDPLVINNLLINVHMTHCVLEFKLFLDIIAWGKNRNVAGHRRIQTKQAHTAQPHLPAKHRHTTNSSQGKSLWGGKKSLSLKQNCLQIYSLCACFKNIKYLFSNTKVLSGLQQLIYKWKCTVKLKSHYWGRWSQVNSWGNAWAQEAEKN